MKNKIKVYEKEECGLCYKIGRVVAIEYYDASETFDDESDPGRYTDDCREFYLCKNCLESAIEKGFKKMSNPKKLRSNPIKYNYEFESYRKDNATVVCPETTLEWQQSGSDKELSYSEAKEYIIRLNQNRFAGFFNWRLPTIEELMSLLKPEENSADLYIDPLFDNNQWHCWSADPSVSGGAFVVYFALGVVSRYFSVNSYVRAVRSIAIKK